MKVSEYLLEVLTQEVPPSAQKSAAGRLGPLVREKLAKKCLDVSGVSLEVATTPRRLVLIIKGLPERTADRVEEKKGPSVHAPQEVLQAFMRAHKLASLQECGVVEKGGESFYILKKEQKGEAVGALLQEVIPEALKALSWPRAMRWVPGESFSWPRPITSLLSLLDGAPLPINLGPLSSGATTMGHRFLAPASFEPCGADDYRKELAERYCLLDAQARQECILQAAQRLLAPLHLTLAEDKGLLEEVVALTEWPVVVLGHIEPSFMQLPPEVLKLTLRAHQRFFSTFKEDGKLSEHFLAVLGSVPKETAVVQRGLERVLRARLSDATFLWQEDQKTPLEARCQKLDQIVFHQKIGTMKDKVERVASLAHQLYESLESDPAVVDKTIHLMKGDLLSAMVGEFPELQGIIGSHLARAQGAPDFVADAIRDHYRPLGPSEAIPQTRLGQLVALVDKLDTLIQFFSIKELPTASRDPFALRRMALGIVRILHEGHLRVDLAPLMPEKVREELLEFLWQRLTGYALEVCHHPKTLLQAVRSHQTFDVASLLETTASLQGFLKTREGERLLEASKRLTSILSDFHEDDTISKVDPNLFEKEEEGYVWQQLSQARSASSFEESLAALAPWSETLDRFFEAVLVNAPSPAVRINRLRLLESIRLIMQRTADFSTILAE